MRISDWSSDVCSSDLIAGTVIGIEADNTELVKQGQTLVKLDPTDTRVALRQAEAALAQAVRHTRTIFVKNDALKSDIAMRQANIETARVDLAKAKSDLKRRRTLAQSGGVSGGESLPAKKSSEERREGKGCVGKERSRGGEKHKKKKN